MKDPFVTEHTDFYRIAVKKVDSSVEYRYFLKNSMSMQYARSLDCMAAPVVLRGYGLMGEGPDGHLKVVEIFGDKSFAQSELEKIRNSQKEEDDSKQLSVNAEPESEVLAESGDEGYDEEEGEVDFEEYEMDAEIEEGTDEDDDSAGD